MKTLLTYLTLSVLSACAAFAQSATEQIHMQMLMNSPSGRMMQQQPALQALSPTEQAQAQVNIYSPSGRMLNHNEILAAMVNSKSAPATSAGTTDSERRIIKLLENIDISLGQQNLDLKRLDR
jgi:tRNA G37 N-methylase TrmD